MIIGVAGPYSADTESQRQKNLDAMNFAAARLLEKGHIPLIGVNAALPVVAQTDTVDKYKVIMSISLTIIDKCEGLLLLAESPGANNAGLAVGLSDIQDGDPDDWDTMLDTNVKGLLNVSKAVMPLMIARSIGHIVNISSIAGKEVYPKGNVYCASKHAVGAITKAMRIELLPHHIRVTSVSPGLAETEFSVVRFKGDSQRAKEVYKGLEPLHPEDVADCVFWAATRPAHVHINDITLTPTAQATARDVVREG